MRGQRVKANMSCGHLQEIEADWPHVACPCWKCGKDDRGCNRVREIMTVKYGGKWYQFEEWRDRRHRIVRTREANRNPELRKRKLTPEQRNLLSEKVKAESRMRQLDEQVVSFGIQSAALATANLMWARGYFLGTEHANHVLSRIAAAAPAKAAEISQHLKAAEHGRTPDRALYSQFGQRAIESSGRGT